jgi:GT2 family glycosyltransferase
VLGFLCCSAVVRRAAFLAAGGFDPVLFFVGEERLLAWDLAAAGWELCYLDEVLAHHQPSARRSPPARRHRQELRNTLLCTWLRRRPVPLLTVTASLLAARARDPQVTPALIAALRELPAVIRRRRALPPGVERMVGVLERGR